MKSNTILILILILGAFLRFYRLPEMVNFDFDQEFAANFAYSVIKDYPITLIGQGLSIQGLFMGPWYFYYLVPFFFLSGLDPIGGAVGSVILGLIIVWVFYFVAKNLFSVQAGLIAAFFRAVSFSEIEHDWSMAPSYGSVLLVLLTWWLFSRYWKGELKVMPWLTFIFGLYTSIHPILFPFYFVFIFIFLVKVKLHSTRLIFLSFITFLIPVLPLLLFEYFRKFIMTKQLWSMIWSISSVENVASTRISFFLKAIYQDIFKTLGWETYSLSIISLIIISVSVYLVIENKFYKNLFSFHFVVLPVTFFIFLIYYGFFPSHVPEYYLMPITILVWLYFSALLGEVSKNLFAKVLIIIFLFSVALTNFGLLSKQKWQHQNLTTLFHKNKIAEAISSRQAEDEEFFVSYIADLGWNFGFDYLFKFHGRVPQTREVKDPIYTIVVPKSLSPDSIDIGSGNVGLILPDNK